MTNHNGRSMLPAPSAVARASGPLLTRTPDVETLSVPQPRNTQSARKRSRPQPLREGDPACWAWPAFNFRGDPEGDSALRAFYAWHKGRCGMCGEVPEDLVVDHDHNIGLVRGLLCDSCNKAEGRAKDPRDVFARWRAVPSAAILGLEVVYRSPQPGRAVRMPLKVTGPVYMPEWAPAHYPWPPDRARGSQPPVRPQIAGQEMSPSTAGNDEWPVQVGEFIALGLRARPHGEAVCHVGTVACVTKFGIQIDLSLYVEDDDGPELHTVAWSAIEEIKHGDRGPRMVGEVWEFCTRWRLGERGFAETLRRRRRRKQERELRRQGETVRGYL
jgi:hypothetical protein